MEIKLNNGRFLTLKMIYFSFKSNYPLIAKMAKREILSRYRGSIFGILWSVLNPLLMLSVYSFFFLVIFKSKWVTNTTESVKASFVVIMFSGLLIHGFFTECITRATTLIYSNASYVKKVVFPLEILPWINLITACFNLFINLFFLCLLHLLTGGTLTWTVLFLPVVLIPYLLLIMGMQWILAATGVYVRDITYATSWVTSVLLFMSPVFYALTSLSPQLQTVALLNPLTLVIEDTRKVLLFGETPHYFGWCIYSTLSLFVAWFGFWWFQKLRKGFADVI